MANEYDLLLARLRSDIGELKHGTVAEVAEALDRFDMSVRRMADVLRNTKAANTRASQNRVWNARGAADLVTIEEELTAIMGAAAAGGIVHTLDSALRGLDRKS